MEGYPPKPPIEYMQRPGQYGEIVVSMTPESEQAYINWLRDCNFAKQALYKKARENDDS